MAGSSVVVNGQIGLPSNRQMMASAGAYFICTNPTPGTAIAFANNTAFSATANGLFAFANTNPVGGKSCYLDRIRLLQTATAPTGGLVTRYEVISETGIVALTGNVATRTPVNVNTGVSNATGITVQSFAAGAATVPAAVGTRRTIFPGSLASGVDVAQTSWTIEFGADGSAVGTTALTAARATGPADLVSYAPPVVIAPNTTVWINLWGITPAANTPSYEFACFYAEL